MTPESTETTATGTAMSQNQKRQGLDVLPDVPPNAGVSTLPDREDEFPEGASEFTDEVSRRRFLGIMGASIALAGTAGCIRPAPAGKILPYGTQPDEVTPGVPTFYATAAPLGGYGTGILVRSSEGRPIKVEGNPSHPSSKGGASVHAMASVLDFCDPDRSQGVTHRGLPSTLDEAVQAVRKALYDITVSPAQPKRSVRLRVLTETVTSPTLAAMIEKLLDEFPEARWVQHDVAGLGNVREGTRRAFGRPLNVTYDFNKADVVLALDADFLSVGPGAVRYSRDFSDRRKIRQDGKDENEILSGSTKPGVKPDSLNRLYCVEPMPTPTGAVADHRLPLVASQVESFARALAAELGVSGVPPAGNLPEEARAWIKPLADDLRKHKGRSIVIAGDHQPASLHALVHAINDKSVLDNRDKTIFLSEAPEARPEGKVIDLKTLTSELSAGQVDVLLILDVNAAYTAPADVPFKENVSKAKHSFHLGTHKDETSVLCHWHVNAAHYLETWGDVRGHDGTVTIQQPLIAPLYNGVSAIELLAAVTGAKYREGYDLVRDHWRKWYAANRKDEKKDDKGKKDDKKAGHDVLDGEFHIFWQESLKSGLVSGTAGKRLSVELSKDWVVGMSPPRTAPSPNDLEINFRPDPAVYDGRFANNGWLQEWPKPVTKLTWDNAAIMSPDTAKRLGLSHTFRWTAGERGRVEVGVVELKVGGRTVQAPAWMQPGHADNSITIHLGYGRTRAGRISTTPDEPNAAGQPVRGFNAYALRTSDAPYFANGLSISLTGKTYFLACTQAYALMYQTDPLNGHVWDRKPVRWGTLKKYLDHVPSYEDSPGFAKIPSMAARETAEINENVPAPKQPSDHGPAHHSHGAAGGNGNGKHDKHGHKHALTMYHDDEKFERFTPGLRPEQQRRWAMAIDLNACTGCGACVIACQSENNIPVVGKEQVTKAREMHWIRVDRYYTDDTNNPAVMLFQPVTCVQCENAPCEIVCPVGATVHSSDGLNDMAYNRCVGTRYCSNNCPYKVRRFNFLTYADWHTNTLKLSRNPDVSVRSRGVMEKCTFCVQRIRAAEIVAEREGRKIHDGEIVTACQAACPSAAITFGDLNDPHSEVAKWKSEPRNYGLLAELNTRPRLTHLAVVRNPNPEMPKWKV